MKIKPITARTEGEGTVAMSLTGFVESGKEYIVRETSVSGKKVIMIYPPENRICSTCGDVFVETDLENNNICDKCIAGF